jgi:hypothetical protein
MISIPLDSFAKQGISADKLASIMAGEGFAPDTYEIRRGAIVTQNIEAARLLNRIRAYTNQSESMPLFLLKVRFKSGEEAFYVTKDPRKIKQDISWEDDQITADEAILTSSGAMRVNSPNQYLDLSRADLKRKYFDRHGGLLVRQFPSLNRDANFIHALLEKGFYVRYGDETGYLFVD